MTRKLSKQHIIKIPQIVMCYFCNTRNVLLLKGDLGFKLIRLKTKILLVSKNNLIFVTKEPLSLSKLIKIKKMKVIQSITKTLIKKSLLDVSRNSYKKLRLHGVGFKVTIIEFAKMNLLQLSLGYSHNIYYKIPTDISIIVCSPTKFIVSGNSSDRVAEVSSQIRKYKIPEPYKGKGILYENEKIKLKEGKKV